jgi:hypothetical protein
MACFLPCIHDNCGSIGREKKGVDLGTFFHQKDFLKKPEMLRTLWSYYLKSILR